MSIKVQEAQTATNRFGLENKVLQRCNNENTIPYRTKEKLMEAPGGKEDLLELHLTS